MRVYQCDTTYSVTRVVRFYRIFGTIQCIFTYRNLRPFKYVVGWCCWVVWWANV